MVKSNSVRIILTLTIFFILSCSSNNPLQPGDPLPEALGWVEQVSPVIDKDLGAVDFINERQGWIVGSGGIILRTNDGGQNWSIQESGVIDDLNDVKFLDSRNGWAVGHNGTIVRTTNGGRKWTKLESGTTTQFLEISFLDNMTGWISGRIPYALLHTQDGGESWQSLPANGLRLVSSLTFEDEKNGIAIADWEDIVSTSDRGKTWSMLTDNTGPYVWSMSFLDSNFGLAIASGYGYNEELDYVGWQDIVLKTADKGNSWTIANISRDSFFFGAKARVFSLDNSFVVGWYGIKHSTNSGETWTTQFSFQGKKLYGSAFLDSETGWAVGEDGLILHTTNGGVQPIP